MQRRIRFRLRLFLLCVTIAAIACAFFGSRLRFYRQQQQIERVLYSARVTPFAPTFRKTDPLTEWMLGGRAFTIDGFIVRFHDSVDGQLVGVAGALEGSQIDRVMLDGCGMGLGGGAVTTCGPPSHLDLIGIRALEEIGVCDLQMINIEMSQEAWIGLKRLDHLRSLSLSPALREEHLVRLAPLRSLRTLRIPRSFVERPQIEAMLPGVEIIVLGPERDPEITWNLQSIRDGKSDRFGVHGPLSRDQQTDLLYALSQLTGDELAVLELPECRLGAEAVTSIERFHSLKTMDLSDSDVTSEMLLQLLQHLPAIRELIVSNCPIDDSLLPALLELEHLQGLWIDGTGMTTEAVRVLSHQKPDLLVIKTTP